MAARGGAALTGERGDEALRLLDKPPDRRDDCPPPLVRLRVV
ncbi:hypothetical protein [Nocardia cyriacigeorgica]|nr:hypothetical protein [Nocardia cyriacigeorgica]